MTEISLKRQARRFAEEHDVSYTRALAAVDEPLHRLKFELMTARHRRPGFLLTDSEDELLEPVASEQSKDLAALFTRKIRGTEVKPYVTNRGEPGRIILELARRTAILQGSGAAHIWDHRMLYRAGLTSENLEPVPNYYQHLRDPQKLILAGNGAALGFVEVAVLQDGQRELREQGAPLRHGQGGSLRLKKITLDELQELLDPTGAKAALLAETYICSKCGREDRYENMVDHPYYEHGEQEEREDLPSWIRKI